VLISEVWVASSEDALLKTAVDGKLMPAAISGADPTLQNYQVDG